MTIVTIEVQRFSLISSKPFDAVVATLKSYLLPYGSEEALAVARSLDAKITTLLRECTN